MKQMIPLGKQSKKKQREYYAGQRGTWYSVNPVTRTVPNGRAYDRNRRKQAERRATALD